MIEHMASRGGGSIVMIGSVAGRTGGTSLSTPIDYAASKGALHVVVRWLSRNAVGRGVLVNGVAPGPVKTAMTAGSTIVPGNLPRGRMGAARGDRLDDHDAADASRVLRLRRHPRLQRRLLRRLTASWPLLHRQGVSIALTRPLALPKSIWPAYCALRALITLPISFGPAAPVSAIALAMAALVPASSICLGR